MALKTFVLFLYIFFIYPIYSLRPQLDFGSRQVNLAAASGCTSEDVKEKAREKRETSDGVRESKGDD